jgi:hypothetical protein
MTSTKFFSNPFIGLFAISWVICICSWFYGIYEMIATLRLKESSYGLGRKVVAFTEPLRCRNAAIKLNEVVNTENGKYKFIESNRCIFRERWTPKHLLRLHTPFRLKGKLDLGQGTVIIEGRLPLGTTMFTLAWLAGWLSGGLMFGLQDGQIGNAILFTLPGVGVALITYFILIPMEKERFLRVYAELKQTISQET